MDHLTRHKLLLRDLLFLSLLLELVDLCQDLRCEQRMRSPLVKPNLKLQLLPSTYLILAYFSDASCTSDP